jgi:hypothetical protein
MPVPVYCGCSAKLRVADHLLGLQIQCPKCKTVHDVPGGTQRGGQNGSHASARSVPAPLPIGDMDDILEEAKFTEAESDRLRDELEDGERLIWAGKTAPGLHMSAVRPMASAAGGIVLSIIIVTAIFIITASDRALGDFRWKAAIPFILMGIGAVVALAAMPFYFRFREGAGAYALTDRRVLIWDRDPFLRPGFHSLAPEDVADFSRHGEADDDKVGSLIVARITFLRILKRRWRRPLGFLYIRGCATLERQLREHLINPHMDRLMGNG